MMRKSSTTPIKWPMVQLKRQNPTLKVAPVARRGYHADDRHDEVSDDRGDQLAHGGADDDAHGKGKHVRPQQELPEFIRVLLGLHFGTRLWDPTMTLSLKTSN